MATINTVSVAPFERHLEQGQKLLGNYNS